MKPRVWTAVIAALAIYGISLQQGAAQQSDYPKSPVRISGWFPAEQRTGPCGTDVGG